MKNRLLFLTFLVSLGAISAGLYLGETTEAGFPLDDAWIHQVYARNLGTQGVMTFNEGEQSTGSTSPAWTLLLAVAYLGHVSPQLWAYFLGTVFAILVAYLAGLLSFDYFGRSASPWIVGLLSLLGWRMAWAALSGMEISFFTFSTLLFFYMLKRKPDPIRMGLITGVAFWIRPESVLLAGIYGIKQLYEGRWQWRTIVKKIGTFTIAALLIITPLLTFNFVNGGRALPNTVTAKYLQYGYPWSIVKSAAFILEVIKFFFWGPFLLLTPFVILMIYRMMRDKNDDLILPLVWIASVVGLYTVALPIIYHHGRYLMPLIPWIAIFGVEGLFVTMKRFRDLKVFWPAYQLALFGMVITLWFNHASTYGLQVELLHQSHMRIADWLNVNTAADAVIATHDVGILGYRTDREILDLAGLITPEVIPIMLDQQRLAVFSANEGADYFVVFSGYYPELLATVDTRMVYSPAADRLRSLGLEPLEVHQIIEH